MFHASPGDSLMRSLVSLFGLMFAEPLRRRFENRLRIGRGGKLVFNFAIGQRI